MNRRNLLQLAALTIAGQAAERVFPFRVYSIPKTTALWYPADLPEAIALINNIDLRSELNFDAEWTYKELNKAYEKLQFDIGKYPIAILPSVDWYSIA